MFVGDAIRERTAGRQAVEDAVAVRFYREFARGEWLRSQARAIGKPLRVLIAGKVPYRPGALVIRLAGLREPGAQRADELLPGEGEIGIAAMAELCPQVERIGLVGRSIGQSLRPGFGGRIGGGFRAQLLDLGGEGRTLRALFRRESGDDLVRGDDRQGAGVEGRGDFPGGERAIVQARFLDLAGKEPAAGALVPQAEEDPRFARLEFLQLGLGVTVAVKRTVR